MTTRRIQQKVPPSPPPTPSESLAEFERISAELKALEDLQTKSKQAALIYISTMLEQCKAALKEAQRVSDLAGVEFSFDFNGDFGATYCNGYWQNSSYNC